MPHRVVICKVREKSFRMRYYELFWTNFDPINEHFSLISKTLIKLESIFRIYFLESISNILTVNGRKKLSPHTLSIPRGVIVRRFG